MGITRWKNKLVRLTRLSGGDKWLLLRATVWLAVARLMLVAVPFSRLSERWSADNSSVDASPDSDYLQRVGRAVTIAGNHVPWRSDCFPRTIAARMLLKSRGYGSTIHLGVDRAQ